MKAAAPEQLTGAHLYLDIAMSGYPFHGYSGGMNLESANGLIPEARQHRLHQCWLLIGGVLWQSPLNFTARVHYSL